MSRLNERIDQEQRNWKRLSGENVTQIEERAASMNEDVRRQTILGGIATEHLPWLRDLKPQETEAKNQEEFAILNCILELLTKDQDYFNCLMGRVSAELHEGECVARFHIK